MVQINKNTWVTPTSYGLVFSHITHDRHLQRVFIDQEASHELITNHSSEVIKTIESKGMLLEGIDTSIPPLSEEKSTCERLIKKNNWKLFSLYPLQMSVQTVNYCNAHCDFCYANVPNTSQKKAFGFEDLARLKNYCATYGIKFGVSGGEPLLHPRIYDILSYRQDQVFDTLITNLTVPVNKDRLIQSQVDLVQVSIHGYKQDHDAVLHLPHAYEMVMDQIRDLFCEINMATNTVITTKNIENIPLLCQDLQDLQKEMKKSLTYVRFVPVVPSGTGKSRYSIQDSFIENVEQCLKELLSDFPDLHFEVPLFHANPYEYFYENDLWVCPAGSTVAVVRIDGHLIPCNQYLDTLIVSEKTVFQKDVHSIWISDHLFSEMRKGIETSHKLHCSECRYLLMNQDAFQ